MANNANVNKVEYGGQTLIDLTGDSVAANKLLRGTTAHDRSGASITGTLDTIPTFVGTHEEWEELTAEEQAEYLFVEFIDDGGYGDSYDIPYNSSTVGDTLDDLDENKLSTDGNIDLTAMAQYNNDILQIPNGLWFIRAAVMNSNTIANRPYEFNTGGILIVRDNPSPSCQYIFYPYSVNYPTMYRYSGSSKWSARESSNPNLLDNPWFTVKQRDITTLSSEGFLYDRWKMVIDIGTMEATNDGIRLDSTSNPITLRQSRDTDTSIWDGETWYTFSIDFTVEAKPSDNTKNFTFFARGVASGASKLLTAIAITPNSVEVGQRYKKQGTMKLTNDISGSTQMQLAWLYLALGWKVVIHAIKVEKGVMSTLFMDTPPNYQQELAKCQRYFVQLKGASSLLGNFTAFSTTQGRVFLPLAVPMRATPTITTTMANVDKYGDINTLIPIKSTVSSVRCKNNLLSFLVTANNANAFTRGELFAGISGSDSNGNDVVWTISAEL